MYLYTYKVYYDIITNKFLFRVARPTQFLALLHFEQTLAVVAGMGDPPF